MAKNETSQPGAQDAREAPAPTLSEAAAALEVELRRFDERATAARKIPLNSEKNLERAARATNDAAESQDKVGERVKALVDAISRARDRQQATAAGVLTRAEEIQARTEVFSALMKRFAALGDQAKELNALVQRSPLPKPGDAPLEPREVVARLQEVSGHMDAVVESARDLTSSAEAEEMTDVARNADALRQQILAARNKLQLLQQSILAKLPQT